MDRISDATSIAPMHEGPCPACGGHHYTTVEPGGRPYLRLIIERDEDGTRCRTEPIEGEEAV